MAGPSFVRAQRAGMEAPPKRVQRQCAACAAAAERDEELCPSCAAEARAQTKPIVGAADDPLEYEADRIAEQVLGSGRVAEPTPLSPRVQRATKKCAAPGEQGTIGSGPLAKWDWVMYFGRIKLGNRVFKSTVTGPDGNPVEVRQTVGAWPWLTNNPGDITVDVKQEKGPRTAQNRAFGWGAMSGTAVSTGHVPLAVFGSLDAGFNALEQLLAEPDYQALTLQGAIERHLGGQAARLPGIDDPNTALSRIVTKLASLGVKASGATPMAELKKLGKLGETAQAFGFAEGVENVGLTYDCEGRDKTDDNKIAKTVWSKYLKDVPDRAPPEVFDLLCCDPKPEPVFAKRDPAASAHDADTDIWQPGMAEGTTLDADTRADMERRFRRDFGQVRVHTGPRAAAAASKLNAHAYTLGRHIVFGSGRYAPATRSGRRLLAHELTHVVQQRAAPLAVAQCDLAIEPRGVDKGERTLSEADIKAAIAFNAGKVRDKALLATLRDVLGIAKQPAVSDRDLALAAARFQASHGVAQDGQLGPVTMLLVIEELQAEGDNADAETSKKLFAKGVMMDIDSSFCACKPALQGEIASADHFIGEYTPCGADAMVKNGPQVEDCVKARAQAAGGKITILGTTAAGGGIALSGARKGSCSKLMERIDLAHEQIHSVHEGELKQAHGAGTQAFTRAREDKADWVNNEIQSRNTDKSLSRWALVVLDRICT